MKSRGRRRLTQPLVCPTDGLPLGVTDGRRVFVGPPGQPDYPQVIVHDRITLCCGRPQCGGHVTWQPGRPRDLRQDD